MIHVVVHVLGLNSTSAESKRRRMLPFFHPRQRNQAFHGSRFQFSLDGAVLHGFPR